MKEVTVTYGPDSNRQHVIVEMRGILSSERLTPKMARQALRIAKGNDNSGEVWDKDFNLGYRVYARSARKIMRD